MLKVVTNVGEQKLQQIKTVSTKNWKFRWDCSNVTFMIGVCECVSSKHSAMKSLGLVTNLTANIFQLEWPLLFLGSSNQWQERQGGEKGIFLVDLCISIRFGQNPGILSQVLSLGHLGTGGHPWIGHHHGLIWIIDLNYLIGLHWLIGLLWLPGLHWLIGLLWPISLLCLISLLWQIG